MARIKRLHFNVDSLKSGVLVLWRSVGRRGMLRKRKLLVLVILVSLWSSVKLAGAGARLATEPHRRGARASPRAGCVSFPLTIMYFVILVWWFYCYAYDYIIILFICHVCNDFFRELACDRPNWRLLAFDAHELIVRLWNVSPAPERRRRRRVLHWGAVVCCFSHRSTPIYNCESFFYCSSHLFTLIHCNEISFYMFQQNFVCFYCYFRTILIGISSETNNYLNITKWIW